MAVLNIYLLLLRYKLKIVINALIMWNDANIYQGNIVYRYKKMKKVKRGE